MTVAPLLFELTAVEKVYPASVPVVALRGCDLRLARGALATITGPSGAGKSTLLNLLGLIDVPTSGRMLFDGADVSQMTERERTETRGLGIGFVFQRSHLIADQSVQENVAMPLGYRAVSRGDRFARARTVLERVGLGDRLDHPARLLSGGEAQRVAVARALVGTPEVLLCDEPTGNLDRSNASLVIDLLTSLHRDGQTVCIVTHDESVAEQGCARFRVVDGRVVQLAA